MSFSEDYAAFYAKYGKTGEGGAPAAATVTTITTSTTTGTTTDGLFAVSLLVTGAADGIIDSVTFENSDGVTVEGGGLPVDSISFNATGTTIRILEVAFA